MTQWAGQAWDEVWLDAIHDYMCSITNLRYFITLNLFGISPSLHLSKGQRGRVWLRKQQPPCLQRDQCRNKSVIAEDLRMVTIFLLQLLTLAECPVRHTFFSESTCPKA